MRCLSLCCLLTVCVSVGGKALDDLNMMAECSAGARERFLHEYEVLLKRAGLQLRRRYATRSYLDVLETVVDKDTGSDAAAAE